MHSTTDQPPPRDRTTPLTADERALRDLWLAEMWPVCHGVGYQPRRARRTTA